ncbi:glycosyltransferase family 4 protein [Pseudorhodoplanes sinuspersici]|nr:glycosyltransferase family 1 protein [Pseudorhodoplanes sinuspersici]
MQVAEARWLSADTVPSGPTWHNLCEVLRSPIGAEGPRPAISESASDDGNAAVARGMIRRAYVEATLNGISGRLPHPAERGWYLHVSHINVHNPARLRWMKARRNLRSMFLIHDLIPISHPEYFLPGEDQRHRMRMETVARQADVVIFNSRATQIAWDDFVTGNQLPRPFSAVVPLGTEDVFLRAGSKFHSDIPYFVVVGTLESRKNLSFLLHVWKAWIQASSIPRARLVIIGRRGRHSENTTDLIDRSPTLASTVVELGELADVGLATLLRGARALLAPSLIEGFGLPIAESLALGVPVVTSDIPAHREVGKQYAEYLDPLDGRAWLKAIDDYAALSSERRGAMQDATLGYRAVTWEEHLRTVQDILEN